MIIDSVIKQCQKAKKLIDKPKKIQTFVALLVPESQKIYFQDIGASYVIPVMGGSEHDVLQRYEAFMSQSDIDWLVRITCDCPCIDHELIADTVKRAISFDAEYCYASTPDDFPDGLDVEVLRCTTVYELRKYATFLDCSKTKEHVTWPLRNNKLFVSTIKMEPNKKYDRLPKMSVDTEEDLLRVMRLKERLPWIASKKNSKKSSLRVV